MTEEKTFKRLCYGTFAKVMLWGISKPKQQTKLHNLLLGILDEAYKYKGVDSAHASKWFNCNDDVTGNLREAAHNADIEKVSASFKKGVYDKVNPNKRQVMVSAIREIIKEDTTIEADTVIDRMNNIKKSDLLLDKPIIDESNFLMGVFIYTVIHVDNRVGEDFASKIEEFLEDFLEKSRKNINIDISVIVDKESQKNVIPPQIDTAIMDLDIRKAIIYDIAKKVVGVCAVFIIAGLLVFVGINIGRREAMAYLESTIAATTPIPTTLTGEIPDSKIIGITPEPTLQLTDVSISETELGDDIFSFTFYLNGVVYTLPAPFSVFEANGWTGNDLAENTISPGRTQSSRLTHETQFIAETQIISVAFVNNTENVLPLNESYVGSITFSTGRNEPSVILPGNIVLGSTFDDVIIAFGEPSSSRITGTLTFFEYSQGISGSSVTVVFDTEIGAVRELRIRNPTILEMYPVFEGDLPDIVLAYEIPDSLGNDWRSFRVRFGGYLYQLPAPVSAFLENGWVITSNPNEMLSAHNDGWITMRKGNQSMRVLIRNYDDRVQPISHGFVTQVRYGSRSGYAILPIELPGGITENFTIQEIIAIWGEPSLSYDQTLLLPNSTPNRFYNWRLQGMQYVQFNVYTETGEIRFITVQNAPLTLD